MGFFPPTGEVDLPEGFFESLKPFMKKQTSPTLPVIRPREDPRITLPDIPPTLPVIRPREDLRVGLPAPVLPDPQLIEVPSDNFIQTDISQESSVISGSVIAFRQASYMRPYLKYSYLGEVIGDLSIVGHAPARYEGRDPLYVVFGNYARSFISFKPRTFSELVPKEIKIEYIMEEVNFNGVAKAKFYLCDNARAVKLVFEDLSGKEIITVYFDYDAYLRGVIEDDSTVFPPEPPSEEPPTVKPTLDQPLSPFANLINILKPVEPQSISKISGEVHADAQEAVRRLPLNYRHVRTVSGKLDYSYIQGRKGTQSFAWVHFDPELVKDLGMSLDVRLDAESALLDDVIKRPLRITYYGAPLIYISNGKALASFYLSDDMRVLKVVFESVKGGGVLTLYLDYDSFLNGKVADPSVVESGEIITILPVGPAIPLEDVIPSEPQEEPTSVITEEEPTSVIAEEQKEEKKSKWYLWLGIGVIILVVFFMLRR